MEQPTPKCPECGKNASLVYRNFEGDKICRRCHEDTEDSIWESMILEHRIEELQAEAYKIIEEDQPNAGANSSAESQLFDVINEGDQTIAGANSSAESPFWAFEEMDEDKRKAAGANSSAESSTFAVMDEDEQDSAGQNSSFESLFYAIINEAEQKAADATLSPESPTFDIINEDARKTADAILSPEAPTFDVINEDARKAAGAILSPESPTFDIMDQDQQKATGASAIPESFTFYIIDEDERNADDAISSPESPTFDVMDEDEQEAAGAILSPESPIFDVMDEDEQRAAGANAIPESFTFYIIDEDARTAADANLSSESSTDAMDEDEQDSAGPSTSAGSSNLHGRLYKSARSTRSNCKSASSAGTHARETQLRGRSRRSLFKNSKPRKTPTDHPTTHTVTSVFHEGSYFQVGDIVSIVNTDQQIYYAQIRGLLIDNYSERSAFLSWLLPTESSLDTQEGFDAATYLMGPDEEMSRKLSCLEFVMHAPINYYHDRTTSFPLPDSMEPQTSTGLEYIWTNLPMVPRKED